MAQISTKGIYAIAAMYTLAHAVNSRKMHIKEIAAMTQISHGYLEQILSQLKKASLVTSSRGANGGYTLAKKSSEITVLEILESVEGTICKVEGNVGSSIILEAFWSEIYNQVSKMFSIKLSEIDELFQPYMYEI